MDSTRYNRAGAFVSVKPAAVGEPADGEINPKPLSAQLVMGRKPNGRYQFHFLLTPIHPPLLLLHKNSYATSKLRHYHFFLIFSF